MGKKLDARGLDCPAPVLLTKKTLDQERPDLLEVLVDNPAAQENVTRFLESQNYQVSSAPHGDDFLLSGTRQGAAPAESPDPASFTCDVPQAAPAAQTKIMVMLPTDRMGMGDDELGKKLVISFIKTLKEMGDELWRLVLVNNGVKLTIEGSPVLEDLLEYEKAGLTILVCGTCLGHFGLMDAKKVGQTTNMLDIVTAMQLADKVISI